MLLYIHRCPSSSYHDRINNKCRKVSRMKALFIILICLLLVTGTVLAEPLSFSNCTFDSSAEYIDMNDHIVEDFPSFFTFLLQFPNLKKVDMYATQLDEETVGKFAAAFPQINFGWTLRMKDYHAVRTDAEVFSTLHDGIHPRHTNEDFAFLKYCTNLKALDLGHNNLTDVAFLECMPELRVLILADNPSLTSVEKISMLANLEYLELFSCGIVDISCLTNLTNLMDLNLSRNIVKDWRPLKEMKQLRRLWISGMCSPAMTPAERQELQSALPDTRIVYFGDPTDNGWRNDPITNAKHPHYNAIFTMFKTGCYVPFEDSISPITSETGQ